MWSAELFIIVIREIGWQNWRESTVAKEELHFMSSCKCRILVSWLQLDKTTSILSTLRVWITAIVQLGNSWPQTFFRDLGLPLPKMSEYFQPRTLRTNQQTWKRIYWGVANFLSLVGILTDCVLGALVKLRKWTICFVISDCLSICLSVHMEQLIYHRTDFHEIWCWVLLKICRQN